MPSHQDRVRQNYCKHEYEYLPMNIRDLVFSGETLDDRKCIKCGKPILKVEVPSALPKT